VFVAWLPCVCCLSCLCLLLVLVVVVACTYVAGGAPPPCYILEEGPPLENLLPSWRHFKPTWGHIRHL
jgi:hypothetical protein